MYFFRQNCRFFFVFIFSFMLLAPTASAQGFIETFDDSGFRDRWFIANFDQGGKGFLTTWRRKLVSVKLSSVPAQGGGELTLELKPANDGSEKPYMGAQLQRGKANHYGRYEVVMTAARGSGVVSAVFTYTGPYFKDPHDEVDLEILGKDTTKIWLNKFVDGEPMPGAWIDLGFDAAEGPNVFAYEWYEDSITWFANGKEIYRVTSETQRIPSHPSRLYFNLWAGNKRQAQWLGKVPPEGPNSQMSVYCVSYRPTGDIGQTCSEYFSDKQ